MRRNAEKRRIKGGPVVFERINGLLVECGGVSSTGEYTGAKTVGNVVSKFTEASPNSHAGDSAPRL